MFGCMGRQAGIVSCQPRGHVGRYAYVIRGRSVNAREDVNKSLGLGHDSPAIKIRTECEPLTLAGGLASRSLIASAAFASKQSEGERWLASRSLIASERSAYASLRADSGGQPSRENRAKAGEPGGNRTHNPQIKSLLLCQLSYRPGGNRGADRRRKPRRAEHRILTHRFGCAVRSPWTTLVRRDRCMRP